MKKKASRPARSAPKRAALPAPRSSELRHYGELLRDVKGRIQTAQTRAMLAVNAELVRLYWDIGGLIDQRQQEEGWGAGVIPRLSRDLHNELPELKGFSERNIGRMIAFHRAYPEPGEFLPQAVAKLGTTAKVPQAAAKLPASRKVPQAVAQLAADSLLWQIPWGHHVWLLEKIKDLPARRWYMEQTLANGWSRNLLTLAIDRRAHERHDKAVTNFEQLLPSPQSDLAQQTLKDPYINTAGGSGRRTPTRKRIPKKASIARTSDTDS